MKFLITAGPTREYIDPVRFISNPSSGRMGYALAQCTKKLGHQVILVSGPISLKPPAGVKTISVVSAEEMQKAVLKNIKGTDVVIMAAAVSDFRPAKISLTKVKKEKACLNIRLKRNPDILKQLGSKRHSYFLAGFAAETNNLLANARRKLKAKNLDMIVANCVGKIGTGFESINNSGVILMKSGRALKLSEMPKSLMAKRIISAILSLI